MEQTQAKIFGVLLSGILTLGIAPPTSPQQSPSAAPITRTELLKQVLPAGNFRNVQAVTVELAPGASALRHRHDVAVLAYVLEGTVENQFDAGAVQTHKTGESWWEPPGTVHDVARNPSKTERARLLIVYIGEEGKTPTVPLNGAQGGGNQRPATLEDGWVTVPPDSLGVDGAALARLTAAIRGWPELGVHAVLIERAGRLIYEAYFDGFDERWGQPLGRVAMTAMTKHDLRSVTKSVVSALTGIALRDGAIPSLDVPVVQWFPEYPALNTPERRRVTLAHVLGMTSGLQWNEEIPYTDPRNDEIRMTRDSAPLRYALAVPFALGPGADFNYNGGLTQVMAAVIERATKTPIEDYARKQLFEPLGITDVEWLGDLAGMPAAASGLRLRPRDLAKFGSLYLHGGRWGGKQVLPEAWVTQSARRQFRFRPRTGADAGGEFGYGYFWWYNCYPTPAGLVEARTAVGNGQQRIFVLPGLDMVVTVLAGRYNDFTTGDTLGSRILREHVIPAVKTGIRAGCPGA